ncbi:MAG: hypothetical protein LM584_03220 [Desulfurococcaceae archaeon]|nr:hypothetical protein [Desulfurococcaceae archaeon]
MRSYLALLAILLLAAPTVALEEPRFTYRSYGYVLVESGWVVEVRVGFWEPLVPGRVAVLDLDFEVREAVAGSKLSIVSVAASTGGVSSSSYVGVFSKVGDRRSLSLHLELSEPRYAKLRPGDQVVELLLLSITGYVENATARSFFTRDLRIPAIIASPAGALKLSIDVPTSVRVGSTATLSIVISNRGANTLYHISVSLYVNESLLDVIYHPSIEPGSSRYATVQFNPTRGGAYVLTAKARYVTQEYGPLNLTYQALVYAKTQHSITITLATPSGEAHVIGVISPPTDTRVYIEASLDALNWIPVATITPRGDGTFIAPVKTGERGYLLVRARIPETERTFESTSNIVVLENVTQTQAKPLVETRTVTYTHVITQTLVQTVQAPPLQSPTQGGQAGLTVQGAPTTIIAGILAAGIIVGSMLLLVFRRR